MEKRVNQTVLLIKIEFIIFFLYVKKNIFIIQKLTSNKFTSTNHYNFTYRSTLVYEFLISSNKFFFLFCDIEKLIQLLFDTLHKNNIFLQTISVYF